MLSILDARAVYNMGTLSHEEWHKRALARLKQATGVDVSIHEDATPIVAEVNDNRWTVMCGCGSGNAVDVPSATARCGSCGAFHSHVILPANRAEIEGILVRRPRSENRNWKPTEPADSLRAENIQHGLEAG